MTSPDDTEGSSNAEPEDADVVEAAATAAENVVFSRYDRSEVDDIDITVSFSDGQLSVDIYLDAPGNVDRVAEDAMLAAQSAADDLLE